MVVVNISTFVKKFGNKVKHYRERDKLKMGLYPTENAGLTTLKLSDAIKLVEDLTTNICSGCGCELLFEYTAYCVHQFSFDRIDNKIIHTSDNLRIVCWNCNSSGYGSIKQKCTRGCH